MSILNRFSNKKPEEQTPSPELTKELGVDGDLVFEGFDKEETRLDNISIKEYRKMRDTDATVDGLFKFVTMPILAATYGVKADADDIGEEQAEVIRNALFEPPHRGGMDTPFSLVLNQILHAIFEGFALFERVYRVDDNGRLVIKKMARRDSTTLTLIRDKTGGYGGARQRAMFGDREVDVKLPAYKTFLFTYDKASSYLYGRSAFKPIYRNWDKKRKIEHFDSVAIQSKSVKPKLLKRINEAIVKVDTRGMKLRALMMLAKLGEFKSAMSLPSGYDVTELQGGDNSGIHESIERQNSEMAREFVANFMLAGSQGSQNVGSYNLSANQSNVFMLGLRGIMNLIVEHINTYWIADLIDLNFPKGQRFYPTFYFDDFTEDTVEFLQTVFTELVKKDKITDEMVSGVIQQVASRLQIDVDDIARGDDGDKEENASDGGKFQPADDELADDERDPAIIEAEKAVNFAAIEKWMDKSEADFESKATPLLDNYLKIVAENPAQDIELPTDYVKLLESTYRAAYNYGKLSASDELDAKAPKTAKAEAEHLKRYVDFVVQKQTNDIKDIVAAAKLKLPIRMADEDEFTESELALLIELIGAAAAIWLIQAISGTRSSIITGGIGAGRSDAYNSIVGKAGIHLWSSRMEKNTCATCQALNGSTYNFAQWQLLPYRPGEVHFNCRCIEIIMRENSLYELPKPSGLPKNVDKINNIQITRKDQLSLPVGVTKKAALQSAGVSRSDPLFMTEQETQFFDRWSSELGLKRLPRSRSEISYDFMDKNGRSIELKSLSTDLKSMTIRNEIFRATDKGKRTIYIDILNKNVDIDDAVAQAKTHLATPRKTGGTNSDLIDNLIIFKGNKQYKIK